jgi:molybdate transport system substrate-binding protein
MLDRVAIMPRFSQGTRPMRPFWFAVITLILALMPALPAHADVTISAAISLKDVLEQAKPELEKAAGDKVSFNFGASGTLAGQIRQGAPIDLFISADRATITKLIDAKVCDKATEEVIAQNTMVLIIPDKARSGAPEIRDFDDLAKDGVKRVAVGEPKVVPAGAYAKETLTNLKLWDKLEKAGVLVMGENVAQVLAFVDRAEVDAGLVYSTDAKSAKHVKVVATAGAKLHQPIEYVGAIVSATRNRAAAEKVEKALASEPVQKLFAAAGFKESAN